MISETSAGIVLFRRDKQEIRFLLLHYPSGHWDFVKGKMEKNESVHDTALREAQEETGIVDVHFFDGFEEWIEYEFGYRGELVCKKVVFFLAETNTTDIAISDEHQNYTWADYDTAMSIVTFDNAKRVLTKAQQALNTS